MIYSKKSLIWGFVLTSALGCLLHFFYSYAPNWLTAMISPVNESLWEHVKIVIYPYLLGAVVLTWGRPTAIRPWLFSALIIVTIMLAFAYWYHVILGGGEMWVDIALYFVVMALGFYLPTRFSGPFDHPVWLVSIVVIFLLILAVVGFTYTPPEGLLFEELKTKESWHAMLFPYPY
ncbi:MAG: DUF6512 family protein [Eubacteriales bacterium]